MKKTKSSRKWLSEHFSDEYVKKSKKENILSRAYFKLQEIDQQESLFEKNEMILELGAAPGSWTQYCLTKISSKGKIIANDLLDLKISAKNIEFIKGDFSSDLVLESLLKTMNEKKIDLILSDMAPNFIGNANADIAKSLALCEMVLDICKKVLKDGGDLLIKVFQGRGYDQFLKALRADFNKVKIKKPQASRARSKEIYLLARHYKI